MQRNGNDWSKPASRPRVLLFSLSLRVRSLSAWSCKSTKSLIPPSSPTSFCGPPAVEKAAGESVCVVRTCCVCVREKERIGEWPPSASGSAQPHHFPGRNKWVYGLGLGTSDPLGPCVCLGHPQKVGHWGFVVTGAYFAKHDRGLLIARPQDQLTKYE